MSERRYSEEEVEAILRRAADRSVGLPAKSAREEGEAGLTLAELQEIGAEVGIPAPVLAEAARSLERRSGVERTLGLPMTVGHTVPLPREPTATEWERLVADLRETFGARGKLRVHGGLREWYNGNLHASVEPTADGWRLRMGTTKGSARQLMGMGGTMLVIVAVLGLLSLLGLGMDPGELARVAGILGGIGAAGIGVAAVQLPPWARTRREQMEGVARRAEAMLEEGEREG